MMINLFKRDKVKYFKKLLKKEKDYKIKEFLENKENINELPVDLICRNIKDIFHYIDFDGLIIYNIFEKLKKELEHGIIGMENILRLFVEDEKFFKNYVIEDMFNYLINRYIDKIFNKIVEIDNDSVFVIDITEKTYYYQMDDLLKILSMYLTVYYNGYDKRKTKYVINIDDEENKSPHIYFLNNRKLYYLNSSLLDVYKDRFYKDLINKLEEGYYTNKPYTLYKDLHIFVFYTSYVGEILLRNIDWKNYLKGLIEKFKENKFFVFLGKSILNDDEFKEIIDGGVRYLIPKIIVKEMKDKNTSLIIVDNF